MLKQHALLLPFEHRRLQFYVNVWVVLGSGSGMEIDAHFEVSNVLNVDKDTVQFALCPRNGVIAKVQDSSCERDCGPRFRYWLSVSILSPLGIDVRSTGDEEFIACVRARVVSLILRMCAASLTVSGCRESYRLKSTAS